MSRLIPFAICLLPFAICHSSALAVSVVPAVPDRVVPAGPGTTVPAGPGKGHWRTYGLADGLKSEAVVALYQDRDGILWAGTNGGGVSRYDGHAWQTLTSGDGLAGDEVWSIYHDRKGYLWFCTAQGGVSRYDPRFGSGASPHGNVRPSAPRAAFSHWASLGSVASHAPCLRRVASGSGVPRHVRSRSVSHLQ